MRGLKTKEIYLRAGPERRLCRDTAVTEPFRFPRGSSLQSQDRYKIRTYLSISHILPISPIFFSNTNLFKSRHLFNINLIFYGNVGYSNSVNGDFSSVCGVSQIIW